MKIRPSNLDLKDISSINTDLTIGLFKEHCCEVCRIGAGHSFPSTIVLKDSSTYKLCICIQCHHEIASYQQVEAKECSNLLDYMPLADTLKISC